MIIPSEYANWTWPTLGALTHVPITSWLHFLHQARPPWAVASTESFWGRQLPSMCSYETCRNLLKANASFSYSSSLPPRGATLLSSQRVLAQGLLHCSLPEGAQNWNQEGAEPKPLNAQPHWPKLLLGTPGNFRDPKFVTGEGRKPPALCTHRFSGCRAACHCGFCQMKLQELVPSLSNTSVAYSSSLKHAVIFKQAIVVYLISVIPLEACAFLPDLLSSPKSWAYVPFEEQNWCLPAKKFVCFHLGNVFPSAISRITHNAGSRLLVASWKCFQRGILLQRVGDSARSGACWS